jgi:prepilin-type N-terminal cleavage/methylation domain-containing protein
MSRRLREQGFTLIELLIVVAIIGLLAAMLIPNMLDALQKAKQKRTLAECRLAGGAMMSWITDQASAAAAGASAAETVDTADYPIIAWADLKKLLVPTYVQNVPDADGWHTPYEYHLNTADPKSDKALLMRSAGRDAVFQGDTYTAGAFDVTDYDQDIVWINGFFVRWPQKLS